MKKVLSALICLSIVMNLFACFSVSASAASVYNGSFEELGETVYWELNCDRLSGEAYLSITGKGFVPNSTYSESWHIPLIHSNCDLVSVTIGEGITGLMDSAFAGEKYLTNVSLPSTLVDIGDSAFLGTGLTELYIPEGVKGISGGCFAGSKILNYTVSTKNKNLTSVDGVIYSKDKKVLVVFPFARAFQKPSYRFQIPSFVNEIGTNAFIGAGFDYINIPGNVKTIGRMAFASSGLKKVVFNRGVETIYNNAFLNCTVLKDIHIPASVKYVGMFNFGYKSEYDYQGLANDLDNAGIYHAGITSENAEYYANKLENDLSVYSYYAPVKSTRIYAPQNSAGHKYAVSNGLTYIKSQALSPKIYKPTLKYNGVQLYWTKSTDAIKYYIYRKDLNGVWRRIGSVNNPNITTYLDKNAFSGRSNIYTVRAYNSTGYSAYNPAGVESSLYIKAPIVSKITKENNGVRISWNKVSGADGYRLYRKTQGSNWKYIARLSSKQTSYLDKNLKYSNKYFYTLRTEDAGALSLYNTSGYSFSFMVEPKFSVLNSSYGVDVNWILDNSADSYRVYRKTANSNWKMLCEVSGKTTKYIDKTVSSGVTYYYTVRSRSNGVLSSYNPKGQMILHLKTPLKITTSNGVNFIKVSWNRITGAQGYYVYRKTNVNNNWKRVAIFSGNNILNYIDKTVENGKTYIYTVRAYNGKALSGYKYSGIAQNYISAPKVTSVMQDTDRVVVEFTPNYACDGYRVYRKIGNSNWKYIDIILDSKNIIYYDYKVPLDADYNYTVRAFKGNVLSGYYEV